MMTANETGRAVAATQTREGLATFLVWFSDDTGADEVSTYSYVDAKSEAAARAEVLSWGVPWADVIVQGDEFAAGWEVAKARREYRAARGDL